MLRAGRTHNRIGEMGPPMRKATAAVILLTIVGTGAAACGGDSATNPEPGQTGAIQFSFHRTVNSSVPSSSTQAFVRIWNPTTGFDQVKEIQVPDPGSTTQASFTVETGNGYLAGVMPHDGSSLPVVLGAGRSDTFTVEPDTTTEVQVPVSPWDIVLSQAPDSLVPGDSVRISAKISSAPVNGFLAPRFGATLCYDTIPSVGPCSVATSPSGDLRGDSVTVSFNVPNLGSADSLYFYYVLGVDGRAGWDPGSNVAAKANLPETAVGDSLFALPVRAASGDVTVSF